METDKITVRNSADPFERGTLGNLTARQYAALEDVVRLSPGYMFEVRRYHEHPKRRGSSATHICIWRDDNDMDYVALVGNDSAEVCDGNAETKRVALRIAHRVYRATYHFENANA